MASAIEYALQFWDVKTEDYQQLKKFGDSFGYKYRKNQNWCGVFVSHCMVQLGHTPPADSQVARKWLKFGRPVEDPKVGDIVVYWRNSKKSWQGHVGWFIRREDSKIYTLGGNQSGRVGIMGYSDSRLLGFRRI